MSDPVELHAQDTALLVMDFQPGIVAGYGGDDAPALVNARRLCEAARSAGIRVIFVTVGFREGYPEVASNNKMFGSLKQSGRLLIDNSAADVHPKLERRAEEVHVIKRRVGAFGTTDLDTVLRANRIETLVMCGIATSGVVLTTLRVAADLDYRCVVVSDACADRDPDVHACLMEKVFPRQASIVSTLDAAAAFVAAQ